MRGNAAYQNEMTAQQQQSSSSSSSSSISDGSSTKVGTTPKMTSVNKSSWAGGVTSPTRTINIATVNPKNDDSTNEGSLEFIINNSPKRTSNQRPLESIIGLESINSSGDGSGNDQPLGQKELGIATEALKLNKEDDYDYDDDDDDDDDDEDRKPRHRDIGFSRDRLEKLNIDGMIQKKQQQQQQPDYSLRIESEQPRGGDVSSNATIISSRDMEMAATTGTDPYAASAAMAQERVTDLLKKAAASSSSSRPEMRRSAKSAPILRVHGGNDNNDDTITKAMNPRSVYGSRSDRSRPIRSVSFAANIAELIQELDIFEDEESLQHLDLFAAMSGSKEIDKDSLSKILNSRRDRLFDDSQGSSSNGSASFLKLLIKEGGHAPFLGSGRLSMLEETGFSDQESCGTTQTPQSSFRGGGSSNEIHHYHQQSNSTNSMPMSSSQIIPEIKIYQQTTNNINDDVDDDAENAENVEDEVGEEDVADHYVDGVKEPGSEQAPSRNATSIDIGNKSEPSRQPISDVSSKSTYQNTDCRADDTMRQEAEAQEEGEEEEEEKEDIEEEEEVMSRGDEAESSVSVATTADDDDDSLQPHDLFPTLDATGVESTTKDDDNNNNNNNNNNGTSSSTQKQETSSDKSSKQQQQQQQQQQECLEGQSCSEDETEAKSDKGESICSDEESLCPGDLFPVLQKDDEKQEKEQVNPDPSNTTAPVAADADDSRDSHNSYQDESSTQASSSEENPIVEDDDDEEEEESLNPEDLFPVLQQASKEQKQQQEKDEEEKTGPNDELEESDMNSQTSNQKIEEIEDNERSIEDDEESLTPGDLFPILQVSPKEEDVAAPEGECEGGSQSKDSSSSEGSDDEQEDDESLQPGDLFPVLQAKKDVEVSTQSTFLTSKEATSSENHVTETESCSSRSQSCSSHNDVSANESEAESTDEESLSPGDLFPVLLETSNQDKNENEGDTNEACSDAESTQSSSSDEESLSPEDLFPVLLEAKSERDNSAECDDEESPFDDEESLSPEDLFPVLMEAKENERSDSVPETEDIPSKRDEIEDETDDGSLSPADLFPVLAEENKNEESEESLTPGDLFPVLNAKETQQEDEKPPDEAKANEDDSAASIRREAILASLDRKTPMTGSRQWNSVRIPQRNLVPDHSDLEPQHQALLDAAILIDLQKMTWRNRRLEAKSLEQEIAEAMRVLSASQSFSHPLHAAAVKKSVRSIAEDVDDDLKSEEEDEFDEELPSSLWSAPFFKSTRRSRRRSCRRFIDLTDGADDLGFGEELISPTLPVSERNDSQLERLSRAYSVDFSSARTMNSVDDSPSIARRFIDLTREVETQTSSGRRRSMLSIGSMQSGRSLSTDKSGASHETKSRGSRTRSMVSVRSLLSRADSTDAESQDDQDLISRLSGDETASSDVETDDDKSGDGLSIDSDEEEIFTSAAWERADEAFMEEVQDIARHLENVLERNGLESPFWSTHEIIPRLDGLHSQLKVDLGQKGVDGLGTQPISFHRGMERNEAIEADENEQQEEQKGGVRFTLKGFGLRLSDERELSSRNENRSKSGFQYLSAKSDLGSDLDGSSKGKRNGPLGFFNRNRTRQKEDTTENLDTSSSRTVENAYLQHFLYQKRRDRSVSLPRILAAGLDKQLSRETVQSAGEIIQALLHPLCPRRSVEDGVVPPVHEIVEAASAKVDARPKRPSASIVDATPASWPNSADSKYDDSFDDGSADISHHTLTLEGLHLF